MSKIPVLALSRNTIRPFFDSFRQVDTARTRKYGGNGLGLAICKNLAKLLGGNIWVESELDKYSDFFFTIPISSKSQGKD